MLPVFKTGERQVHPVSGVFDSHALPPIFFFNALIALELS